MPKSESKLGNQKEVDDKNDHSNKKRRRDEGEKHKDKTKDAKEEKKIKSDGLNEIDALFALKKDKDIEQKKKEAEDEKKREDQMKFFRDNAKSSSTVALTKNAKNIKLSNDRTDVQNLQKGEWVNDGLGGVFDSDGFTGRREEGVKVYKAHLFNKKGFGTTPDCPFDCDCCYI